MSDMIKVGSTIGIARQRPDRLGTGVSVVDFDAEQVHVHIDPHAVAWRDADDIVQHARRFVIEASSGYSTPARIRLTRPQAVSLALLLDRAIDENDRWSKP